MPFTADLLVAGRIHTMDAARPAARAMAVWRGRIVALDDDALALRGPRTELVTAPCILPGLHDAHLHFLMLGTSLSRVDLFEVPSLDEALHRVAEHARGLAPGAWILGRGWKQDLWPDRRFPTAADLDRVTGDHPALLRDKSGHAAWANSKALRLAGIDSYTADPPGGLIGRDAEYRPTGMLFEDAAWGIQRVIPEPTADERIAAVRAAQERALAGGLTCVQCMDGLESIRAVQGLAARGELRLRVVHHFHTEVLDRLESLGLRAGFGDGLTYLGNLKLFADGALGPRTAWMLEPYEGEPDNLGVATIAPAELRESIARASRLGFASCVHAIGDRACREVLDAIAAVRAEEAAAGVPPEARRHRIEHVQVLHPDDLPRLAELAVTASMQPIHATQDIDLVDRYWGARGAGAYAFRRLLEAGTALAFGSDAPVEDANPFVGLHAAVTRRRADGTPGEAGWYPEQRLTVAEALAGFTHGAARSAGVEAELGRLMPGLRADFVLLGEDPPEVEPMRLRELRPRETWVGGVRAWSAQAGAVARGSSSST